jgi:hypothetical protein
VSVMEEITNPKVEDSGPPVGTQGRIADALLSLCLERGYPNLTLPMVLERAGVDTAEFERHNAELEDCILNI